MNTPGKPQMFQLEPDLCGCTVDRSRPTIMRSLVSATVEEECNDVPSEIQSKVGLL